jgi:hypothetical protein
MTPLRAIACAATLSVTTAGAAQETVAGLSRADALLLGERMYREGILPSGAPMTAVLRGDMPVEGTMFSCANCHLRSGVGSIEGRVSTLPTNAGWLFQPLVGRRMRSVSRERLPEHLRRGEFRPAYTDETLGKALRAGVDPTGRRLDPVMPRWVLDDRDLELMVFYLKNLSAEPSPGVTPELIRFATVIAGDVDPLARAAMLAPLQAHVEAFNSQTRAQERRARYGPFFREEKLTAYRRLELAVWELTGPPETWRAQLETHLRAQPVFAFLGGIASGEWRPVHEFCEEHRIPSLFPITDFPVVSQPGWYTLYFSKGWFQEGEAAARYLRGRAEIPLAAPAVQVRRDEPAARALARGFQETRQKLGQPPAQDVVLGPGERADEAFWVRLAASHPGAAVALWLAPEDLASVAVLAAASSPPALVFASGKLLGERLHALPDALRPLAHITYPYSLPGEQEKAWLATRRWLKSRGISPTHERIQSQMYFVGWMLAGAVHRLRHDFYRDYLLDIADMMRDEYYSIAAYPRLSFGPGQRFAAKGTYVVQLGEGPEPGLVKRSEWVIH